MSGKLVLIRHGESEWNLQGRWTGWTDVGITPKGAADARKMGELLRDIHFDEAYNQSYPISRSKPSMSVITATTRD